MVLTRQVQRALNRLPVRDGARILEAIEALAANPRPAGCVKLSGTDQWRIRSGDHRILYEIQDTDLIVTVVRAGHRRDVYR